MRIFYAAADSPDPAYESRLWRHNLHDPLVALGHDLVEFQFDLRDTFRHLDANDPTQAAFIAANRPRLTQSLLSQVRAAHRAAPLDLFFSYFYDACVLPEAIDEIRSMGIRTMNWYCNASYQLHLVSAIAPRFDWCLVPEKFRLEDYRRLGARPLYCQEAANPDVYKPQPVSRDLDVAFVGQRYGNRPAHLRHLVDAGVDVRVWGAGWAPRPAWRTLARRIRHALSPRGPGVEPDLPARCCGGPLDDASYIETYSRAKISLGFSTVAGTGPAGETIRQIRLRDFEAPMSGAFYLVEHFEEIEAFFEPDREIVCFRSPEELVAKAKQYLADDTARERIRLAGMDRARRDHTWQRRFQSVFREAGLQ